MKRKIIIISTIIATILIFVLIANVLKDHMDPSYFGEWRLTGIEQVMGSTPLEIIQGKDDDRSIDGSAEFSEKIAIFDEKKIEQPDYITSDLNKEEFFNTYGINLVEIGINSSKVSVVEVKGFDKMRLIVKNSKEVIIYYNKVFLGFSKISLWN